LIYWIADYYAFVMLLMSNDLAGQSGIGRYGGFINCAVCTEYLYTETCKKYLSLIFFLHMKF
jgi:hypothetical protein